MPEITKSAIIMQAKMFLHAQENLDKVITETAPHLLYCPVISSSKS